MLICWHSDRVERRGPEFLFSFLRQIKDAGGRIESVKEPLLGTEDLSGEAVTALNAVIAHQYSVHLGEQVRLAHTRIKANNGLIAGGKPWGYEITGEKYSKTIVPTGLCREIAPQIFERCINGDSCRTIAAWLDTERVPTMFGGRWNEGTVHRILTNMTYAGCRQNEGALKPDGKLDRRTRHTIMTCEPVITMGTFEQAQMALHNRPGRGPGGKPDPLKERPLLANLRCARCGAPMYRIRTGRPEQQRQTYYRCAGKSPQRHGCGNMIFTPALDRIVIERVFLTSEDPYRTREWVEGEDFTDAIASVKQDIREVTDTEEFGKLPELTARLTDLRQKQANATKGHWIYADSGMTEGEHFYGLDGLARREYLATRDIRAEKIDNPEPGASRGAWVVIDGQDHGTFPYPPPSTFR